MTPEEQRRAWAEQLAHSHGFRAALWMQPDDPDEPMIDAPNGAYHAARLAAHFGRLALQQNDDDFTRVDGVPEGAHGDLPRPATE